MSVQLNAVSCKPTLYMVLYCLTPARFHRYSSLTLCPPYPAWGEKSYDRGRCMHLMERRRTSVVNKRRATVLVLIIPRSRDCREILVPDLLTIGSNNWPLELMHCLN